MSGKAAKIYLSEKMVSVLESIVDSELSAKQLVRRASIILFGFAGLLNTSIAEKLGIHRKQVGVWRRRWQQSYDALIAIECRESNAAFQRAIKETLSDAPRSGSGGKFSATQVTEIIALACEPPEKSKRPIDNWTHRELTDEIKLRKIVDSISESHVGNLLRQADLQPHKSIYWLNTKEKDPVVFRQQVKEVCQTYLQAPDLLANHNTHTVSVDEMCGIQALQRIAPSIAMSPGKPERIEYEYKRHGTLCLIGNWDVVLGQMLAPSIGRTRTELDFARHIHETIATDRDAGWIFIVDRLNIHCSESLVRYVAMLEGIPKSELGKKGKHGILKSMATRMEFLSDKSHRVRFVYIPKHTSWLNQIEIIFGIINRRAIKRGSFDSIDSLRIRLKAFIEYFNLTFAKPFQWTYTGRPTNSKPANTFKTWRQKWKSGKTSSLVA